MLGRIKAGLRRGVRVTVESVMEFIDGLKLKRSTRGYIVMTLSLGGSLIGFKMIKEGTAVEALEHAIEIKRLENELKG